MKTITLTQPWATLVAIGAKRIETRSWKTSYRGPLAIHASRGFPKWAKEFAVNNMTAGIALNDILVPNVNRYSEIISRLPLGCVIATCRLVGCIPTWELQCDRVIECDPKANCDPFKLDGRERAFGDYSFGRWAWLLADIKPIDPVPAKGSLSLWEWDGM